MAPIPQTVGDIIDVSARFLENRNIPEARPSCELLMSRLLNCGRLDLLTRRDSALSAQHVEAMRRGLKRLASGEPVHYITGTVEFMGHNFKTDKRALIPRPETELLVAEALKIKGAWDQPPSIVLDIGTGSGCIIISLACSVEGPAYVGFDISDEALSLAKENASSIEPISQIHFRGGSLEDILEPQSVSLVITNPPYIKTSDCEKLPVHIKNFEPRTALDGGLTGLDVVEQIVQDASILLRPKGHLLMEIGFDQGRDVTDMLSGYGFENVAIKKDYAGHDRIAHAEIG